MNLLGKDDMFKFLIIVTIRIIKYYYLYHFTTKSLNKKINFLQV